MCKNSLHKEKIHNPSNIEAEEYMFSFIHSYAY